MMSRRYLGATPIINDQGSGSYSCALHTHGPVTRDLQTDVGPRSSSHRSMGIQCWPLQLSQAQCIITSIHTNKIFRKYLVPPCQLFTYAVYYGPQHSNFMCSVCMYVCIFAY